ncbi:hypothetical protein J1N35_039187 [Gossypium stocksii]|uniref:Uncharacterized protein n=1 Tax=Gossypium stocksii TaxID=47602 RepID=A0A9D3UNA7_9ROSI|nr:hypothetical protein J1N35_039187 [Gossypium stocksii]
MESIAERILKVFHREPNGYMVMTSGGNSGLRFGGMGKDFSRAFEEEEDVAVVVVGLYIIMDKEKYGDEKKAEEVGKEQEKQTHSQQESKQLGKRLVLEESPPPSPPLKQTSKSLMIQNNPLSSFLRDYQKQLIPKISAMQLSKKEDESLPKSSSEEISMRSSYSSSYSFDEESKENFQKIAQTQPKVEVPSDNDPMMDETNQGESSSQVPKTTKGPSIGRMTFTLDNIPPEKWPARIQEFHSWLDTRKLTEESNYNILLEFVSRFTGMLRDWWNSIDLNSQMHFLVLQNLSTPIRIIHQHFVGNPDDLLNIKRNEFFKRKCCSYSKKRLVKKGHFAKNCPNNKKGAKMIRQIQEKARISIERDDDLESLFSIEDEPTEKTLCAIPTYFSEDESDYSDSSIYMTMPMLQKQH